jgi:hypothetical protein
VTPTTAGTCPSTNADPLGDDSGIVKSGGPSLFDDIVTMRWLKLHLAQLASATTDWQGDDDTDLAHAAESMRYGAALVEAWKALERNGQARAGDLFDVVDLFIDGRGSVAELAASVARGVYCAVPRDDDEHIDLLAIRRLEQLAEDAALAEDIFSVRAAVDILERNLRYQARRLASAPPGDREFERLGEAVDDLREILVGAAAFRALRRGEAPVKARDLGDAIEVYRARRGSISQITADVLAGAYRDHPRDGDGELMFDGRSRERERRVEAWRAQERWLAGSRRAPDRQP